MPDYYYQIKGRQEDKDSCYRRWEWPPLFTGKVTADNKKQAKAMIDEEYGRTFPQRVLRKDMENHHYLLNVREITEDDERTRELFDLKKCQQCKKTFRRIDLYNDLNESYKGSEYCSDECQQKVYEEQRSEYSSGLACSPNAKAVIYQVQNLKTGMSYVGKTTQVFTLRWYQHFYHGSGTKFHKAIQQSNLEDWSFGILETVAIEPGSTREEREELIASRERWWISEKDSINNGYNTATV